MNQRSYLDYASLVTRWLVGLLFIYMGLSKALDPVAFLKLVRQYNLTNDHLLLNVIAAGLPWFEVFCGLLLILGIAVRGTALIMIGMLIPFTILVTQRALGISSAQHLAFCAVKFDCGCGSGEVLICRKILENTGLVLACLWLLRGVGHHFSLLFSLFPARCCHAAVKGGIGAVPARSHPPGGASI